jgi:hypothetical protein
MDLAPSELQALSSIISGIGIQVADILELSLCETRLLGNFCPFHKRPIQSEFERRKRVKRDFVSEN